MFEVYGPGAGFVDWGLGTFLLLSSGFGWVSDSQTSDEPKRATRQSLPAWEQ